MAESQNTTNSLTLRLRITTRHGPLSSDYVAQILLSLFGSPCYSSVAYQQDSFLLTTSRRLIEVFVGEDFQEELTNRLIGLAALEMERVLTVFGLTLKGVQRVDQCIHSPITCRSVYGVLYLYGISLADIQPLSDGLRQKFPCLGISFCERDPSARCVSVTANGPLSFVSLLFHCVCRPDWFNRYIERVLESIPLELPQGHVMFAQASLLGTKTTQHAKALQYEGFRAACHSSVIRLSKRSIDYLLA